MEFDKKESMKLLSYLEGELQARDIVIAALKMEKAKQMISVTGYQKKSKLDDPLAALFRDNLAMSAMSASRESSAMASQSEKEMRSFNETQLESLSNLIKQQRCTQFKMIHILKDAEEKHKKLVLELDEERQKHEHDTAQGDDITYGLEIERTKLKKDLEQEKVAKEQLEANTKSMQEAFETERVNNKQIVLFLLAERKKIIMKYVEERKRSQDLAQILTEEKFRFDSISEGLEEESKKSLRMEADMEKQTQTHDQERKTLLINVANEEKKVKDLELELNRLRMENEQLKKSSPGRLLLSSKSDESAVASSSVAKVIQPTATVSSVPVSGPTTGIARSVSPGQCLRQSSFTTNSDTIRAAKTNGSNAVMGKTLPQQRGVPPPIPPNKPVLPPKRDASAVAASQPRILGSFMPQPQTAVALGASPSQKDNAQALDGQYDNDKK